MNANRPAPTPHRLSFAVRLSAVVLAVAAMAAGLIYINEGYRSANLPLSPPGQLAPATVRIGAPFDLVDHRGHPTSDRDFAGRKRLIVFASTGERDRILAALQVINSARELAGPAAARLALIWITTDPARDTPEKMSALLAEAPQSDVVGLTGPEPVVRALTRAFFVPDPLAPANPAMQKGAPPAPQVIAYLMDQNGVFLSHRTVPPDPAAFAQWLVQSL